MANDDHDLDDDFDLDDDLELPEFDDGDLDGAIANDRKPVDRVAGGFLNGVKDTSMNRNFQRKLISQSLPDGYGKAFDDVGEAAQLGQDLYDSAATALRPYEKTIKKIGRKVTEKSEKFLPEKLSNKLKDMTAEDNDRAGDKIDPREAEITANLAGIFEAQAQSDAEQKAEDETRENVKEVVNEQRHRSEIDVLKTMRSGIDRMVAYQDRVTAGYQKKSLELQFRQLFVARDQYALMEAHVKENKLQLQAISKNTALPEFVKLRGSEAMKQIMREKAYGGLANAIGRRSRDFTAEMREKIQGKANEFISSMTDGIQGIGDAMEMTEGVQIDGMEMGGQAAAGFAMDAGVNRYGRKIGNYLGKIPGVKRMGDRLEYFSDNKEDAVRGALTRMTQKGKDGMGDDFDLLSEEDQEKRRKELAERSTLEKLRDAADRGTGGAQAAMARMALDFIGPEASADRRYSQGGLENLSTEVAPYTSLADRSITEIIPGLLTNILHEAEMIRTGRDDVERRVYDADARTFRREGDVQRSLMDTVMPDRNKEGVRQDLDEIVDEMDTNKIMSEQGRESLKRKILDDLAAGRGFRVDRYSDVSSMKGEVGDDAYEIASLMKSQFLDDNGEFRGDDKSEAIRNNVSRKFRRAGDSIPTYQDAITKIYSVYGPEMLREMGLMTPGMGSDNSLDTKTILDDLASGTGFTSQGVESKTSSGVAQRSVSIDGDLNSETDMSGVESKLAEVSSMLGRFVEVSTGWSPEDQFKNVLKAIGKLDVREHVDLTNDWLKKIYELLKDCCGPDGGPGGGGPDGGGPPPNDGGGPMDGFRSAWDRTQLGVSNFRRSAWDRTQLLAMEGQERLEKSGLLDRAQQGRQKVRDKLNGYDIQGRANKFIAGAKDQFGEYKDMMGDIDLRDEFGRLTENAPRNLNEVGGMVSQGYDKARNQIGRLREVDLSGHIPSKDDVLNSRFYQDASAYGNKARAGAMDVYGRVKEDERVQQTTDKLRQGRDAVMDRAGQYMPDIDISALRGKASGALGKLNRDELTKLRDQLGELVELDDYRLKDQPRMMMDRGKQYAQAAGSGLSNMRGNIEGRASSAGKSLSDRFDRTGDWVTGNLDEIRSKLSSADFDLTEYLGADAANDPRQALSALQKMSEETLAKLEEAELSSQAKELAENVSTGTRSVLAKLKDKVSSVDWGRKSTTSGSGESTQMPAGGDFWTRAWDMLTNLKGHMDDKTAQIIEALLVTGPGDPAEKKPGAFKRLGGNLMSGAGGIANFYGKTFGAGGNLIAGAGRGARGVLGGLGSRLGGMIRGKGKGEASDQEDPIVDIYLEGREDPVMLARDLRQGLYFDQESLEEVYRINDVKGAVVDNQANVVVTDEDVSEGRLYTLEGKTVKSGIMSRLSSGYMKITTGPMRAMFSGVKRIGEYLVNKAKEPQDIYVKGEESPRLLAVVMKNGGYLSKTTQKPITSPQDIDGDVIDRQGNTLLTEAELRDPGIVNARGKAIRSVGSGLGEIAKKAGGALSGFYRGAMDVGRNALQGIGNLFGGGGDGSGGGLFGGGKQVEWLKKIHDMLDARLEKPKKEREGSWRQLLNEDDDEDSSDTSGKRKGRAKEGAAGAGLLGGLGSILGSVMDKFGGAAETAANVAGGGAAANTLRNRNKPPKPTKKGWGSKLWSGAKKAGKGLWNVGKSAAKFALPAIATVGKTAAIGAAKLAAGAATAVGSVISAPVLLTGAAVAAVGVGAYLLYKNFANDPEGPLHRFRLRQYGLDPDSGDPVARINALEDKLEGEVMLRNGQASINQGVDPEELLEISGIDKEDEEAVSNWAHWFQKRFKPVFLTHVALVNGVDSNLSLADVDDDMEKAKKIEYLKKSHFKEGSDDPYRETQYVPFEDLESMAGPGEVRTEYDKSMKALTEDDKKASRSRSDPSRPGAVQRTELKDVSKPKTEGEKLREGVDRREKDSPTAQELDGMSKETYDRLSSTPKGRLALRKRRRMKAALAEKDRQGGGKVNQTVSLTEEARMTDEELIALYESGSDRPTESPSSPRTSGRDTNTTRTPNVSPRQTLAGDYATTDARLEERRRREQRVAVQTESQTQKNASVLNGAVNRMVGILSESTDIQRNIDKSLSELNTMFKERYSKERKGEATTSSTDSASDAATRAAQAQPEINVKSAPWPTNR